MEISDRKSEPMTYMIAVANQKGGVAKTTTVVSMAGALAQRSQDVLVVDLDSQANLTLAMGLDSNKIHGAIADVLLHSDTLASVSRETSISGIDLVPSNAEMDLAERFLPVRQNYEFILRDALKVGKESRAYLAYDFVLLDCPPSMGAVTLNAMNAADLLIIPTQPEYFSAHALRAMMQAIRKVRAQSNPGLVYRILITMQDKRNRIHRNLSEQIRATFGEGLFKTIIETDTKLRESAIAGMPITYYRSQSRSALQYDALAQELIEHVQEKSAIAPRPEPA
jgi:chromosome partitioning protein